LTLNQHARPGGLRNLAKIDTKLLNLESLSEINRAGKAGRLSGRSQISNLRSQIPDRS